MGARRDLTEHGIPGVDRHAEPDPGPGRAPDSDRDTGPDTGPGRGPDSDRDSDSDRGPEADPAAAARSIALRRLTHSPQTRGQLAEALRRRGIPDDVTERVLNRFTEVGLIDDAAFAAAWVESRHAGRGLARRALAHELRQRGVAPEIVEKAVDELDTGRELAMAKMLVAAKLSATRDLDHAKRVRRLAGLLARKGYSAGLAFRAVREVLEEAGDDIGAPEVMDEPE